MPSNSVYLTLNIPDPGDGGWGTLYKTLFTRLDLLLGRPLLSGDDPNVTLVEGFRNNIIVDSGGVAWICTTTGTPPVGVWEKLGLQIFIEIGETRNVWVSNQAGVWTDRTPDVAANELTFPVTDAFILLDMSGTGNVLVKEPSGAPAASEAQSIVMRVSNPGSSNEISFDPLFFEAPGGGGAVPSPPTDGVAYYTLLKSPGGNLWTIHYSLGYTQ